MTSNPRRRTAGERGPRFSAPIREEGVLECLKGHFTPEFLGRIDKVAVFRPLSRQTLEKIAAGQLARLQARAGKNGLRLRFWAGAGGVLAGQCGKSGAREIRRNLQNQIENPLSQFLLLNPPGNRVVQIHWNAEQNQAEFRIDRR